MPLDSISTLPYGRLHDPQVTTASRNQYHLGLMTDLRGVKIADRKYVDFAKDIEDTKGHLDKAKSCLSEIKNILQKNGPDTRVRLKNGVFKGWSGLVKNFAFHCRYNQERKEAASNLGVSGNSISAAKAKSVLEERVDTLKVQLNVLGAHQELREIHEQLRAR